jgi:hypothetical protein
MKTRTKIVVASILAVGMLVVLVNWRQFYYPIRIHAQRLK